MSDATVDGMLSSDEALALAIDALGAQQSGATIQRLSGGVSALVFRVTLSDQSSVVLKQSRPVLDVPGFWPPWRATGAVVSCGIVPSTRERCPLRRFRKLS